MAIEVLSEKSKTSVRLEEIGQEISYSTCWLYLTQCAAFLNIGGSELCSHYKTVCKVM